MELNHPSLWQQIYSLPRYPYGISSHVVRHEGLEPTTPGLKARYSTN